MFATLSVAAPFTVEHYTLVGTQNWERDVANEGTEYTVVENPPDSNNWDFTLINPNNVQWNIKAHDPTVDSINLITANVGGPFFTVIVGDAGGHLPSSGPYDHALTEPMSPGCKNFNGVATIGGAGVMKLVIIASGSINGTIDVEEAARLRAVNITADIENDATAVKPINILTSGDFSGSYLSWGATLESLASPRFTGLVDIRGEIGRIETTSQPISGTVFGDTFESIAANPQAGVFSPSGTSDMVLDILGDMPAQITVDGDFIGSLIIGTDLVGHASHPTQGLITIDGRVLSTGNVSILGDMKANSKLRIGTPTTGTAVELAGFVDVLGKVEAGAQIDIDGDMDGFMEFGDLEGNVEIAGEVGDTANIWMSDLLDGPGGVEELDITNDLAGQIIINKLNDGSVWSGTIEIGGRRFSTNPANANDPAYVGPRYSFDGAGFGGGAIGLTRFDFHEQESTPQNGATVSGAISTARIMYYGPVDEIDDNPGQSPV